MVKGHVDPTWFTLSLFLWSFIQSYHAASNTFSPLISLVLNLQRVPHCLQFWHIQLDSSTTTLSFTLLHYFIHCSLRLNCAWCLLFRNSRTALTSFALTITQPHNFILDCSIPIILACAISAFTYHTPLQLAFAIPITPNREEITSFS